MTAKKDVKREGIEFFIKEFDIRKNFELIQEAMKYKNPAALINLLKKNKDLISEELLEELIIKYSGEASGVGNSAKLEKFKVLLNKYDPNTNLATIMIEMGYSKARNFMNYFFFTLKENSDLCARLGLENSEYDTVHAYTTRLEAVNFSNLYKPRVYLEREEKVQNYLRSTKTERLDFFKLMPLAGYKMETYLFYFLREVKECNPEFEDKIDALLLQHEMFELKKNIGKTFYNSKSHYDRFKELFPGEPVPSPLLPKANILRQLISSRKRTDLTPKEYVEQFKYRLKNKLGFEKMEKFESFIKIYSETIFI